MVPGTILCSREQHSRHVFCSRGHYLLVGNDLILKHFLARDGSSVTRTNSISRAGVVFFCDLVMFFVPEGIVFVPGTIVLPQGATFQTCVFFPGPLSARGKRLLPGAILCQRRQLGHKDKEHQQSRRSF